PPAHSVVQAAPIASTKEPASFRAGLLFAVVDLLQASVANLQPRLPVALPDSRPSLPPDRQEPCQLFRQQQEVHFLRLRQATGRRLLRRLLRLRIALADSRSSLPPDRQQSCQILPPQ